MAQYKTGTVSVTNGSQTVTGSGTAWASEVAAGDIFTVVGTNTWYEVGAVVSDTELTLAAEYAGSTQSGADYAITRDFTSPDNIPYPEQRDIETASLFKRAMLKVQELITSLGSAITDAIDTHEADPDPHDQYAFDSELGTAAYADTGTDPDQVPTNADLGSAAYEDADAFASRIASPTPGNLVQQTADGDLEDAGVAPGQLGTPIGGYIYVQTDVTGTAEPDSANHIRLKAGEDGAGEYNEGKLTSESVSGTAPYITATAVISNPDSPLDGQAVHLLETERRFFRAGSAGTLEDDELKSHTHDYDQRNTGSPLDAGSYNNGPAGTTRRASYATGGAETRPRNIGVAVYMRIK